MKIDFSNKWYRETCKENGLDPDNELSKSAVAIAYEYSKKMKKYIDAKAVYESEELQQKLDEQIDRLNNERINYMLEALYYAEVMAGLGGDFNEFAKQHLRKTSRVVDASTPSPFMTEVEKRVSERWEQAMRKRGG